MNNYIRLIFVSTLLLLSMNCLNVGYPQGLGPSGSVYSEYKFGTSGDNLNFSKEGRACTERWGIIYGFITTGDSSVKKAAEAGNITKISTVDKEGYNILSVYTRLCTVVKGN